MSDVTNKYQLRTPITKTMRGPEGDREETITELVVRKPRPRDLRVTDKHQGDVAKGIALAAHLTGLTIGDIDDRMELEDFQEVMKIVEGFTPTGLPTGQSSSA